MPNNALVCGCWCAFFTLLFSIIVAVGTASGMTTPSELNKSKPYTELSVTVPSEVTKSLETSRKPVVVNIKGEKGKLALSDKPKNKAPMVETIVVQLPGKIKTEDENKAQLNVTGPGKTHLKASVKHGTTVLEIPEGEEEAMRK